MTTPPPDLAKIIRDHRNIGPHWAGRWVCAAGCESDGYDPCLPYRLAELAQKQADELTQGRRIIAECREHEKPCNCWMFALAGEQS